MAGNGESSACLESEVKNLFTKYGDDKNGGLDSEDLVAVLKCLDVRVPADKIEWMLESFEKKDGATLSLDVLYENLFEDSDLALKPCTAQELAAEAGELVEEAAHELSRAERELHRLTETLRPESAHQLSNMQARNQSERQVISSTHEERLSQQLTPMPPQPLPLLPPPPPLEPHVGKKNSPPLPPECELQALHVSPDDSMVHSALEVEDELRHQQELFRKTRQVQERIAQDLVTFLQEQIEEASRNEEDARRTEVDNRRTNGDEAQEKHFQTHGQQMPQRTLEMDSCKREDVLVLEDATQGRCSPERMTANLQQAQQLEELVSEAPGKQAVHEADSKEQQVEFQKQVTRGARDDKEPDQTSLKSKRTAWSGGSSSGRAPPEHMSLEAGKLEASVKATTDHESDEVGENSPTKLAETTICEDLGKETLFYVRSEAPSHMLESSILTTEEEPSRHTPEMLLEAMEYTVSDKESLRQQLPLGDEASASEKGKNSSVYVQDQVTELRKRAWLGLLAAAETEKLREALTQFSVNECDHDVIGKMRQEDAVVVDKLITCQSRSAPFDVLEAQRVSEDDGIGQANSLVASGKVAHHDAMVIAPSKTDDAEAIAVSGASKHSLCFGTYIRSRISPSATNAGRVIFKGPGTKHLYYWANIRKWLIGDDYTSCRAWLCSAPSEAWCPTQVSAWREWDTEARGFHPIQTLKVEKVHCAHAVDVQGTSKYPFCNGTYIRSCIPPGAQNARRVIFQGLGKMYLFYWSDIRRWMIGNDYTSCRAWLCSATCDTWCPTHVHEWKEWDTSSHAYAPLEKMIVREARTSLEENLRIEEDEKHGKHLRFNTIGERVEDVALNSSKETVVLEVWKQPQPSFPEIIASDSHDFDRGDMLSLESQARRTEAPIGMSCSAACAPAVAVGRSEKDLAPFQVTCDDAVIVAGTMDYPLCLGTYSRSSIPSCDCNAGRTIFKGPGAKYLFYWDDASKWLIGDDYSAKKAWLCSAHDESWCPSQASAWREWDTSSRQFVPHSAIKVQKVTSDDAVTITGTSYPLCAGTYVRTDIPACPSNGGRAIYKGPGVKFLFYWEETNKWLVGDDYTVRKAWLCSAHDESFSPRLASAWREWNSSSMQFEPHDAIKVDKVTCDDTISITGSHVYPRCLGFYVRTDISPCEFNAGRAIFKGPGAKYLFYWRATQKWLVGDDYRAHKAWLCSAHDESWSPSLASGWREWNASSRQFEPLDAIKVYKVACACVCITGTQIYPLCLGSYVRTDIPPCELHAGRAIFKGPGAKYLFYWCEAHKWLVGDDYRTQKAWLCSAHDEGWCPSEVSGWREWDASSRLFKPQDGIKVQKA